MDDNGNATLKGQFMGHVAYWLRDTTPLHKFLDVLILFIAGTCGLGLWMAWNSEEALIQIVAQATSRYPTMDVDKAAAGFDGAWAIARDEGAVSIEVYSVDLSNNARTLVRWASTDPEIEAKISSHKRRPLLSPAYDCGQVGVIADLITGDPSIGERSGVLPGYLGLYIPIPDKPGENLCGCVVVSFPLDIEHSKLSLVRSALLSYTEALTR